MQLIQAKSRESGRKLAKKCLNRIKQHLHGTKMKSLIFNLVLAVTAVTLSSTLASAQTLKADIPFAFEAGGKVMAPGTYELRPNLVGTWFELLNKQSGDRARLTGYVREDPQAGWRGLPGGVFQFACGDDGGCALRRIWQSGDYSAYELAQPTPNVAARAAMRLIVARVK